MNIENQLKQDLSKLSGLPCWGVTNVYGSWISLDFGLPKLKVREPNPRGNSDAFRFSRRVTVQGEFWLWLDMCDWTISNKGEELAHSESDSTVISKAIGRIDGQILDRVYILKQPLMVDFGFDLGGLIKAHRYAEYEPDECLWHLYCESHVYSLRADGKIEFGLSNASNPGVYEINELKIDL